MRVVLEGLRPIHGEAEPPATAVAADLLFQPLSVCLGEVAPSSLTGRIHGEPATAACLSFQPLSACLGEAVLSSLTAASALHV